MVPCNALDRVKREWEKLSQKNGERVTEFTEGLCLLHSKLDPHQPMPAEMLDDTYGYKI